MYDLELQNYKITTNKYEKSWLVQLDTDTKRKVTSQVKNYEFIMNELNTHADLNMLSLGSYDLLIGMDQL